MAYLEIEIPRTGFDQETVEVVERRRMEIREGDEVEVVVSGVVQRSEGEMAIVGPKVLRVVRVYRNKR